jgi:hypothetical protein
MLDLYPHDNVTFPKPYADGWDNMAKPHSGVHPFVWSKERAEWVAAADAKVLFVPRPNPAVTWNNGGQPVRLHYQATGSTDQIVGVAFGLTHGITAFNEETQFYYVEARSTGLSQAPSDAVAPNSGVIMYYANRMIPQGQGPVIMRDHVPGGGLDDAVIPINGTQQPGGTGIKVKVKPGTQGAAYNLEVEYTPPATDYDVYIHKGTPSYMSPDIWVDSQKNGYVEDTTGTATDPGELAISGEVNRVYARVFNHGPATAHDIEVAFLFSEPFSYGGRRRRLR